MTLFHKRLLYSAFFVVFFIAVPLILMYASGYRYDFNKKLVQKTGAINIESEPDEAQVWVNGVLQKEYTPAQLRNLLPREYNILVTKEGYIDWQRHVEVKPNMTTFLQKIELFRSQQLPEYIGTLVTDNLINSTSTISSINNHSISLIPDKDKLLLVSHSNFINATTSLATFPLSEYEFHESIGDWLVIQDNLNEILYLMKIDGNEVIERQIISPVKGYDWNSNVNKLLFYNDFELWKMDLNSGKKTLVTRLGKMIDGAVWHPRGNYAIYLTNNEVKIIELVYLQQRQNLRYAVLPTTTDILLNDTGDTLYLKGEIGSQKGWFQLDIQ